MPRSGPSSYLGGVEPRFVDIHSHVVPSGDDGVQSVSEGLALATDAFEHGTRLLYATPHVSPALPLTDDRERRIREASAFVTLEQGNSPSAELKDELRKWVVKEIGALARPDDIRFTDALPKTRSGKIMRRLLRDLASGQATVGDTTTLEDLSVMVKLREEEE